MLFLSTVHTVQPFAGLGRVMFSRLSVQGDGYGARENTRYFYIVIVNWICKLGCTEVFPKYVADFSPKENTVRKITLLNLESDNASLDNLWFLNLNCILI